MTLHVEKLSSNGTPILMLHGWGHTSESFRPLGQLLKDSASIYLIDLPGFGKSQPPDQVWSAFEYAERLLAYMDEHHLSKVNLVGHSFGGKVAMCLSSRYPERVNSLVLISPSGLKRQRSIFQKVRLKAIAWAGKGLKLIDKSFRTELFTRHFAPRYGSADYKNAKGIVRSILVRSVNEDLAQSISLIKAPTLLLWGEKDTETPLEIGHRLSKLIKNSELRVFPNKGHLPFEGVGAHLCAYYTIPFLQEHSK